MFSQFKNESKELKLLCEVNNISPYNSGGGNYHYELDDNHFHWLYNLSVETEKSTVPSTPNDICDCGLVLWEVIESYCNSISKNYSTETTTNLDDLEKDIEKHIKSLGINGLFNEMNDGFLGVVEKKFSSIVPITKSINKEILAILDSRINPLK